MSKYLFKNKNIKVFSLTLALLIISGIAALNQSKKDLAETTTPVIISSNQDIEAEFSKKLALYIIENIDNFEIEKNDNESSYIITEYDSNNNIIRKYRFMYKYVDLASDNLGYDIHFIFTNKSKEKVFTKVN